MSCTGTHLYRFLATNYRSCRTYWRWHFFAVHTWLNYFCCSTSWIVFLYLSSLISYSYIIQLWYCKLNYRLKDFISKYKTNIFLHFIYSSLWRKVSVLFSSHCIVILYVFFNYLYDLKTTVNETCCPSILYCS